MVKQSVSRLKAVIFVRLRRPCSISSLFTWFSRTAWKTLILKVLCVEEGRYCCMHLVKTGAQLKILYRTCIITYCVSLFLYPVRGSSSTAGFCRGTRMYEEVSEVVLSHTRRVMGLFWACEDNCPVVWLWHNTLISLWCVLVLQYDYDW